MGGINDFDVSTDGKLVLTTGQDRKVTYWDLKQPSPVRTIETIDGDECNSLSISHDGKMFVTGGSNQVVRVWDMAQGKVLGEGRGHSGSITSLEFSHDDR